MIVEVLHLLLLVETAADPALMGDDEAGNPVARKHGERLGRAGHPGEIINKMGIAMVDIQRLVTVQEHGTAPRARCWQDLLRLDGHARYLCRRGAPVHV